MIPDRPTLGKVVIFRGAGVKCPMRNTRTWLFAFLPFLYLVIILGFIAFQFSKKSDSFSQSLGGLTVAGKTSTSGQPAELVLRGQGLEFYFDANHSLTADGTDGTTARLKPLSWAWKDGNVVVTFQQGLGLVFEKAGAGGRSLLIHPLANDGLKAFSGLHIPFGPEGGVHLARSDRGVFVEVSRDKTRVLASVDGARDRIETNNTFVLMAGKNGFRPARLDPLSPGQSADLAWLTQDSPLTPASAETALGNYWDKAYAGWTSVTSFSTALAESWGREALARGEYPTALGKIFNLLDRDRKSWGFPVSGFLGDIVDLMGQQRRAIEAASSRSQPDWTGQGQIWHDARLYGPAGSADRVKGLLLTGKLPGTAPELLAVFENLMDIQALQPSDAVSARVDEVAKALQAQVVRREGELYVRTSDGLLDLRSTMTLGRLWLDYSRSLSNEPFGTAGAVLIASALGYQDSAGHLPEFLVTQDGLVVRQEGTVLPEELYAEVKPEAPLEVEVAAWGPGAFLRTPAKVVSQNVGTDEARFSFRFPVGSAEHIIVSGVPSFDHITMHGIRWRTDPQFQSYTDGWSYSASTKTLYVKIKHREDLEELVIHFQPEE
jgi:hypothetical protein